MLLGHFRLRHVSSHRGRTMKGQTDASPNLLRRDTQQIHYHKDQTNPDPNHAPKLLWKLKRETEIVAGGTGCGSLARAAALLGVRLLPFTLACAAVNITLGSKHVNNTYFLSSFFRLIMLSRHDFQNIGRGRQASPLTPPLAPKAYE